MSVKENIEDYKKYIEFLELAKTFNDDAVNKCCKELDEYDNDTYNTIINIRKLGIETKQNNHAVEWETYLNVKNRVELAKKYITNENDKKTKYFSDEFIKNSILRQENKKVQNDIIMTQLEFLDKVKEYSGKFYSDEWIYKNTLGYNNVHERHNIPRSDVLDLIYLMFGDDLYTYKTLLDLTDEDIKYIEVKKKKERLDLLKQDIKSHMNSLESKSKTEEHDLYKRCLELLFDE